MKKTDICYLYVLVCPIGKSVRYVGKSVSPYDRYRAHLIDRKSNSKKNKWIDSLFSLGYTPIIKIEKVVPVSEWEKEEVIMIERYREEYDIFNIQKGGLDKRTSMKPVYCYSLDGKYIRHFNSITEASDQTLSNKTSIAKCCNGELNRGGNFIWSFTKKRKVPPYKNHRYKPIIRYDMIGRKIAEYESPIMVEDVNKKAIDLHLHGKNHSAGGSLWSYKEDICPPPNVSLKKVKIIKVLNNRIYTYKNAKIAAIENNETMYSVYNKIKKKTKYYKSLLIRTVVNPFKDE